MSSAAAVAPKVLKITLPRRFGFLLEMHPYKVAYGGRDGLKSWSFADAILALAANQQLRVICGREVMKSLADSVHKLLSDRIQALGLESFFSILENKIRSRNGSEISYAGLSDQTVESIKSFEGVDIFWVEEAQAVSEASWSKLLPTIRKPNSEVWVSFNPDMIDDATYQRWVINPPPGTKSVFTDWQYAKACGFFTDKMEALRAHDQKFSPDDYENIWGGKPRIAVAGAIFAREVIQMVEERRYKPTPYEPILPVHVIWDLGWNDAMVQLFVQKPQANVINVINYWEDSFQRYDEAIAARQRFRYRIAKDWLPHDGAQTRPDVGKSPQQIITALGCTVEIIPMTGPEQRIKAARMMLPRVYMDNTERETVTGYVGPARLMECLKKYRRVIPRTTGEPGGAVHDEFSHGCDAFGALAEIVDRIPMEFDKPFDALPEFTNPESSMGMLG